VAVQCRNQEQGAGHFEVLRSIVRSTFRVTTRTQARERIPNCLDLKAVNNAIGLN
jgi:hypothetical protein